MKELFVFPHDGKIMARFDGDIEPAREITDKAIQAVMYHFVLEAQECDGHFSKTWHDKDHLIELTIRPAKGLSRKDNCTAYTNQFNLPHRSKVFALHNLDESMMYIVKLDPSDDTQLKLQTQYCEQLNGTHKAVLTPIPIEKYNAAIESAISKLRSIKHEIIEQEA